MKKVSIVSLLFVLLLTTCSNSIDETQFIGTWKLVKLNSSVKGMTPTILAAAEEEALSRIYILNKDKTVHLETKIIGKIQGTWNYDKGTQTLEFSYKSTKMPKPEKYKVDALSAASMKWSQNIGNMGQIVMVLKKE